MRILLSIFFLFTFFSAQGQIVADKKVHHFGELYPNAQTYVDIKFTNKSGKKHFLLNVDKPRDVYYRFSGKTILPDSSIIVRLKINDGRKGKFNHDVDIYFSDSGDPITIRLTGNVKEVSSNPLTDCPDFSNTPQRSNSYQFAITVKVIDSLTLEPIKRAKVFLVKNNTMVGGYYTNKDGIVHREVPMGYYFVTAEKEAYKSNYKEGYFNFQRNYIEIKLKQPPTEIEEPEVVVAEIEEEEIEIVIETPVVNEPPVREPVVEIPVDTIPEVAVEEPIVIDPTPLNELPDSLFDEQHFKMNNITFILDVSSSMNSSGKLALLKLSMTELVKTLRSDDLISVIKYSSNVSIVVNGLGGDDKEEINRKVSELRTSSSTAGGDAIKIAYRMNRKIYSPERSNIVIMITDGAFNKGSKDYLEAIENNYNERGIIFSVVGIKTSPYITTHMENIVNKGGGQFIEVRSPEDAKTKIIKEIRRTSYRAAQH